MRKNILFVLRSLPHSRLDAQEGLDVILTMAAFDQAVSLLLLDDGVFQLKRQQQPEILDLKVIAPVYQALELYDVQAVYVEIESLQARALTSEDLFLPVTLLPRHQVRELMQTQDVMFNY